MSGIIKDVLGPIDVSSGATYFTGYQKVAWTNEWINSQSMRLYSTTTPYLLTDDVITFDTKFAVSSRETAAVQSICLHGNILQSKLVKVLS